METRAAPTEALFVTGMQRSGTTLLEKLLAGHPQLSVLSQPFPLLFVEAKREFLAQRGINDPYPLGNLFLELRYGPEDFSAFLAGVRFDVPVLAALFARMADYSGQYTRFGQDQLDTALAHLVPGDFAAIAAQLYHALSSKPGAALWGGKETLGEELLPYLLDRGFRCLLILRDPRDVLASLNYGSGQEYGGSLKPTLFNVRNWRKSVAFALHLGARPGFAWLRYEDLVCDPLGSLDRIARMLGIAPFPVEAATGLLLSQSGAPWQGNSSHGLLERISAERIGAYRRILPETVARYVEAACYPELRRLGYSLSVRRGEVAGILDSFEDAYEVVRNDLRGYADHERRAIEEISRFEALDQPPSPDTRALFLLDGIHDQLQQAL